MKLTDKEVAKLTLRRGQNPRRSRLTVRSPASKSWTP